MKNIIITILLLISSINVFPVYAQITGVLAQGGLSDTTIIIPPVTPPEQGSNIVLGELKAFPTAFGYGAYIQGGRGGTIYPITSLSSSATTPGTIRHALQARGKRIIVVKVSGTVDFNNNNIQDIDKDFTLIGQTAPGDGLQIKGARILGEGTMENEFSGILDNFIIRHVSFRYGNTGTPGVQDVFTSRALDKGCYFDHVSMSYGWDETLSLSSIGNETLGDGSDRVTVANSLFGQSEINHNTAHIFGNSSSTPFSSEDRAGNFTYARNITHLISHRFPNFAGYDGTLESYNNIFSSWSARLSRVNGNQLVDWYNNHAISGNISQNSNGVNKYSYANREFENDISIYTKGNIIEGFNVNTTQNPQKNLWQYFLTNDGKIQYEQVEDQFFVTNRQGNALYYPGGLLDADELLSTTTQTAGHTRGAGSTGLGEDVRDALDETYISQIINNTGPSSYPSTSSWVYPTKNSTTMWTDSDNDHISNAFEDLVGLNKENPLDATTKPDTFTLHGRTFDNRERTGGSYDVNMQYVGGTLTGDNLYTWQEIYWSYLANDFQVLANTIPAPTLPEIVLNEKLAFPGAYGYGKTATGGRGGQYIAVTNLNTSGTGSFAAALKTTGPRTIIIKVAGDISGTDRNHWISGSSYDDVTIWGQFAPPGGLTLGTNSLRFTEVSNVIGRFFTSRSNENISCTPNTNCYNPILITTPSGTAMRAGSKFYLDHIMLRNGRDEQMYYTPRSCADCGISLNYNIFAEGERGHNTAVILGQEGYEQPQGYSTYSRNFMVHISHRFPNVGGEVNIENFNNYVYNYDDRLMRVSNEAQIDYHRNYVERGNIPPSTSSAEVNKWRLGASENGLAYIDPDDPIGIYTAYNYIENYDEVPDLNEPKTWAQFSSTETAYGVSVGVNTYFKDYSQLAFLFKSSPTQNSPAPSDGYWNTLDVKNKILESVGPNRFINSDGTPYYGTDSKATEYINWAKNNSGPSTFSLESDFEPATYASSSTYTDSDGDFMPDWFEDQHSHLNKNNANDRDTTQTNWIFSNYTVRNTAGYTNLEICAAFYAGDFETILTGTNKIE